MLYEEIIWAGVKTVVGVGVAVGIVYGTSGIGGNPSGQGFANFPGPVYPGTVSITDGATTWTETAPGSGILVGAGAGNGTGTIDYAAGVANVIKTTPVALNVVLNATFTYSTARNNLPSPVAPMFANLIVDDANGEFIILIKDSPGVWRVLPTLNQVAYENVDLGPFPTSQIAVFATAKARLKGYMANAN